jgi:undecaprenyl-diphosphatase
VTASLAAGVFLACLVAVTAGALSSASIDGDIVLAAHRSVLAHPALLSTSRAVTQLGAPVVVDLTAAVAAAALWLRHRRAPAVFLVVVRVTTALGDTLVKVIVQRARPMLTGPVAHASGYSFPSGHSAGAASFWLPLAIVLMTSARPGRRRLAIGLAVTVCVAVAASRVLLGVHYPSDAIAGVALGVGISCAFWPLTRAYDYDSDRASEA